jgi:hypothetical protein
MLSALRSPFDPRDVQFKPSVLSKDGRRALAIAYVEARAVMDRLDEVVGPGNWKDCYRILADRRDREGGQVEVECRLAIRLGDQWIVKADVGVGDDLKAAYSDALKRVGVKWGIGRYLYSLPAVWADYDQTRREFADPEALRRQVLGSGEERRPVEAPNPAATVTIRTRQGEKRLSELTSEQLRWVAENYGDEAVRAAARSLLAAAEEDVA